MSLSAEFCRREAFSAACDMSFAHGEGSDFYNSALFALCEFVVTADDDSAVAAWSIFVRVSDNSDGSVS